jgi:hypothetical protein
MATPQKTETKTAPAPVKAEVAKNESVVAANGEDNAFWDKINASTKIKEASRIEIDGTFEVAPGNRVAGHLKGLISGTNGNKSWEMAIVELATTCVSASKKDEDGRRVPTTLQKGQHIGLFLTNQTLPIRDYVENQGFVRLQVIGKKQIKGGNSVWEYKLGLEGEKKALVTTSPHLAEKPDFSDIPF